MPREVLRAILKGNIEKFDDLIQQGIVVNEVTEKERWNYLHRALMSIAMPPTLQMVKHLISSGVDVNAIDIYGNNSLHYAMRLKDANIVRALLDANVDVNHLNEEGVSPLREALLTKPFDHTSIQLLLEHVADVEQKVEGGLTVKELVDIVAGEDTALIDLFNK